MSTDGPPSADADAEAEADAGEARGDESAGGAAGAGGDESAGGAAGRGPGAAARWRGLSRTSRAIISLLLLVVAINAVVALVSRATAGSTPSGPDSSSLSTTAGGYEGWADVLARYGHTVTRVRVPLDEASLAPGTTVIVADPRSLSNSETSALGSFLSSGGRVVALGVETLPFLERILGDSAAPRWSAAPVLSARPAKSAPEVAGVQSVAATGNGGSWSNPGATTPLLSDGTSLLATTANVGRGRLVMFSDSSPFSNGELATADNAQLAIDVVGRPGGAVAFDEDAHGYGAGLGWAGLPLRWQWALVLGAIAAGLWVWGRAWRFGPPELARRRLPPPRRAHIDALATALARSRPRSAAIAPVRAAARERLASRAGTPADGPDEVLAAAARAAGVPEAVVASVLDGGQTGADALAAGRALAWLEETVR